MSYEDFLNLINEQDDPKKFLQRFYNNLQEPLHH